MLSYPALHGAAALIQDPGRGKRVKTWTTWTHAQNCWSFIQQLYPVKVYLKEKSHELTTKPYKESSSTADLSWHGGNK